MLSSYFLKTDRIGFRHWGEGDLPLARFLWGDPKTTEFIGGPFSEDQIARRLNIEIQNQERSGIQYWPIFLLEGDTYVGCAGLRPYRSSLDVVELGVHLLPEFWRRGLAEEAVRAVIRLAFSVIGATALFAGHHPENSASQRLLTKLGFQLTHEDFYPPTGRMHPSYLLKRS